MTALEPRTNFRSCAPFDLPAPDSPGGTALRSLTQAVHAAVREVDDRNLRPVRRHGVDLAVRPKTLLALLSYCYARDIYGSAEIEDAVRGDGHFRQLCGSELPCARMLRLFRHDNREALHFSLTAVLRLLAGWTLKPVAAVDESDDLFAEEASRRITKALLIDAIEPTD